MKQTARRTPPRRQNSRRQPVPPRRVFCTLFSPHEHFGRLLHKRHTSYPLLALLLILTGILLVFSTVSTQAATVNVAARANGPIPTAQPVIVSPVAGTHFDSLPIPVSGTCDPDFLLKLYRNDVFSGSAICSSTGTFTISSDLFAGQNDLQIRSYNLNDQAGPVSDVVTVYYDPPVVVAPNTGGSGGSSSSSSGSGSGSGGSGSSSSASKPFFVATDYYFLAAFTGQTIKWEFTIVGGQGPYKSSVNWGDGYSSTDSAIDGKVFTALHAYKSALNKKEFYPVTVEVTDAAGHKAHLQTFAIMNDKSVVGSLKRDPGGGSGGAYGNRLLHDVLYVWPAYFLIIMVLASFWLGEKRGESIEYNLLQKQGRVRKRA